MGDKKGHGGIGSHREREGAAEWSAPDFRFSYSQKARDDLAKRLGVDAPSNALAEGRQANDEATFRAALARLEAIRDIETDISVYLSVRYKPPKPSAYVAQWETLRAALLQPAIVEDDTEHHRQMLAIANRTLRRPLPSGGPRNSRFDWLVESLTQTYRHYSPTGDRRAFLKVALSPLEADPETPKAWRKAINRRTPP